MKRKEVNKKAERYITVGLLVVIFISLDSCEFKRKNQLDYTSSDKIENKNVAINVKEARLFSEVAKLNLQIVNINRTVAETNNVLEVKMLAHTLEKSHREIRNLLNETAKDKLILLPNTTGNVSSKTFESDNNEFRNFYKKKISVLIEEEINKLENLRKFTNDLDLKIKVVKIIPLLKSNLDQLEQFKTK